MTLAFQKRLTPEAGWPRPTEPDSPEYRLDVAVVFTSSAATITALRKAAALAHSLGARVTLVVPQVVPFPLPLESPPVLLDFSEQRLREIALDSPVETTVLIYLCRDCIETLRAVLARGSLVVVGGRRRWWPTKEKTLVRQLRRAGHEVVFAEME